MIEVPLIRFVDFAVATGTGRVTRVREIKEQMEAGYEQGLDYWKRLRDAIVEFHRNGDMKRLEAVVRGAVPTRQGNYEEAFQAYKKFLRKAVEVKPRSGRTIWHHDDLGVVVNPELRVTAKGNSHAVKLYFRKEKLSQRRLDVALHLMRRALETNGRGEPAILDVRRAKLFTGKPGSPDLNALLAGEARAFIEIWRQLTERAGATA